MAAYSGTVNFSGLGWNNFSTSTYQLTGTRALSGAGTLTYATNPYWLVPRALSGAGTLAITRSMHGNGAGTLSAAGNPRPKPSQALGGTGTLAFITSQTVTGAGIRGIEGMNEWTVRWWESLPAAYRAADAKQNLEFGGYPLAKFMYGIGAIAGLMRDYSDQLWFGTIMDPERTPDDNLPWLGQMLGLSVAERDASPELLREYIIDVVSTGLPAVGTRQSIIHAAKRFMIGTRQTTVIPSPTDEFTLVLLVKSTDVPDGDLQAFAERIRAIGVIPAGYVIEVIASSATWAQWSTATGATWAELHAAATTWAEADSLGVSF